MAKKIACILVLLCFWWVKFAAGETKQKRACPIYASVASVTDNRCFGTADGSVTFSVSGGTGSYLYSLDGYGYQGSPTFNNVAPGDRIASVQDYPDGCTVSVGYSIKVAPVHFWIYPGQNPETCTGRNDGVVSISSTGGNGPVEYSLDGSFYQTSGYFPNLPPNTYGAYVRDSQMCVLSASVSVSPANVLVGQIVQKTDASCSGANDGSVMLRVTGGTGSSLSISWNGGAFGANWTQTNLAPGTYNFRARDSNGCIVNGPAVIINRNSAITTSVNSTKNQKCTGTPDGTISFSNTTGGNGNFTYSINNGTFGAQPNFTGLAAGVYRYAVNDSSQCQITGSITVSSSVEIITTVNSTRNRRCSGSPDGTITFSNTTGGNGGIMYSINNGPFLAQSNFTGLPSGVYHYAVNDSMQCQTTGLITVDPPVAIHTSVYSTRNEQCSGSPNGMITFSNYSGGYGSLTFSINNGPYGAQSNFTGLPAGVYRYAVNDSMQCQATGSITVDAPIGVVAIVSSQNNIPYPDSGPIGNFTITASQGAPPYQFSINNNSFGGSNSFSGLDAGTYEVTVKDSKECKFLLTLEIVHLDTCGNSVCEGKYGESCSTCIPDCGVCSPSAPSFESLYTSPLSNSTIIPTWPAQNSSFGNITYVIELRNASVALQRYKTTETRYIIGNLFPDTLYSVVIAAEVQINGSTFISNFSTTVNVTTSGLPESPQLRLTKFSRNYLEVEWDYPNDHRSIITYFLLSVSNSSVVWKNLTILNNGTKWQRLEGLQANQQYYFTSQSLNLVGPSIISNSSFRTDTEFCGDGVCDANVGEDCTSCFFDCPTCSYPTCPGTSECSGRGTCNKGVCDCFAAYAGPSCSLSNTVPIDVKNNTNNRTDVTIVPMLPNESTSFVVALKTIQEINSTGHIVTSYDLTKMPAVIQQVTISNSIRQVTYNCSLPNRATLILSLYVFTTGGNYTFANNTIVAPDNSVKYSIEVYHWSFRTIRNKLQIIIATEGNSQTNNKCKTNTSSSEDGVDNLKWFTININGIILYAQFIESTLIDGRIGKVHFAWDESMKDVVVTVPSFWDNIYIDPVFSVLFDPVSRSKFSSACDGVKKSPKITGKIAGGVVGAVVGTAAVVAAGMYAYKVTRRKKSFNKIATALKNSSM